MSLSWGAAKEIALQTEHLISFTADIASAYVSNNKLDAANVGKLVEDIHQTLASLGVQQEAVQAREPVVSIKASLKKDHLICLACGKKMKMLKRHIASEHGLSPEEYRSAFGLSPDYPMIAPNYADRRRDIAKEIGLGKSPNPNRGRKPGAKTAKGKGGTK